MKRCFKCGDQKPLSEFYNHPRMADGHLGKCKTCTKLDSVIRRATNLERIKAYDNSRARLPHRKEGRKKWRATADKDKMSARVAAIRAYRKGIIKRTPCVECGGKASDMHHPDYSRPLNVVWLCVKCHHAKHRKYDYSKTVASRKLIPIS